MARRAELLAVSEPTDGRRPLARTVVALAAAITPIVTWILALGASYVIQDFVCAAAASAGSEPPAGAILLWVTVINSVLLGLTLVAGATGLATVLRARSASRSRLELFLGTTALALAALVAYSIVLIAGVPFVFEVCA